MVLSIVELREQREALVKTLEDRNVRLSGFNGGRGIRTPGTVPRTAVFKTAGFNHSPIPPHWILPDFITLPVLSLPRAARLGLRLIVGMRVPHRDDDSGMPKQFLHCHNVGVLANEL